MGPKQRSLACRASGKLANLSVHSMANACITHRQGNLTVEVRVVAKGHAVLQSQDLCTVRPALPSVCCHEAGHGSLTVFMCIYVCTAEGWGLLSLPLQQPPLPSTW